MSGGGEAKIEIRPMAEVGKFVVGFARGCSQLAKFNEKKLLPQRKLTGGARCPSSFRWSVGQEMGNFNGKGMQIIIPPLAFGSEEEEEEKKKKKKKKRPRLRNTIARQPVRRQLIASKSQPGS